MKLHFLTIALITLLAACNQTQTGNTSTQNTETSKLSISPIVQPLQDVAPAKQTFSFQNKTGIVKKTARQSLITVPENAFVLEDGSAVTGEVSIEFQEIFNPAEVILSGIPMNVQNNGKTVPFISDGMFSITAKSNGKTAKLAEGKTIAVSTGSEKTNTDFDYWYYNESTSEWENIGDRTSVLSEEQVMQRSSEINPLQTAVYSKASANPTPVTSISPVKETVKLQKPVAPGQHNPNDFVFNISASYTDYPELATYKNVLWKPLVTLNEKEQIELRKEMQKFGANVSLECKDPEVQLYTINYGNSSIQATPVFIGRDKEKAMAAYSAKMKAYVKKLQEEQDAKRIAQKAQEQYRNTYNMFAVNRMGIYNCDRFYNAPGKSNYTFKCGDKPVDEHVFAILMNNEGVIALSSGYKVGDHYSLPGDNIQGFVYTNPQGVVCYAKQQKVQNDNVVDLTMHQKVIEKPEDLQALIQSL